MTDLVEDLEFAVLLELFLECEPGDEREAFLADLSDEDVKKLLVAVLEETGAMP